MPDPQKPALDEASAGYTVIARRYRPQRFEDVVGQDHVVQSLRNAIKLNRVTHAYLFAGTRGVGKTSIARIFAKCLNCIHGPTESPCLKCDICQAIAVGQDIDVIEIDGASNNGVEAVRELRQNAGLRPSRARFKIYYIDEVHMLSTAAFNALLKTLEEPPEHVKFFFATTEPNKIPITVLSRCQRYDFAGIGPELVMTTLAQICEREHVEAEPAALRVVSRRAGGSMRDAQSLLEQLLSSGTETLTAELVHKRLGTAGDERLLDLIEALADRDVAKALTQLHLAGNEGVQPVDLLNGLLDYLRDVLVLSAGAGDLLLTATPRQKPRLDALVERWSIDSILASLQILAEARSRLRGSSHGRLLVELALARVARLENLNDLSDLIQRLASIESGAPISLPQPTPMAIEKKKPAIPEPELTPVRVERRVESPASPPTASAPPEAPPAPPSTVAAIQLSEVKEVWAALIKKVGLRFGTPLSQAEPYLAVVEPNVLVVRLPGGYTGIAEECGNPEAKAKIEKSLAAILNRPVRFEVSVVKESSASGDAPVDKGSPAPRKRSELQGDTMVQKVVELFEARLLHLDSEE